MYSRYIRPSMKMEGRLSAGQAGRALLATKRPDPLFCVSDNTIDLSWFSSCPSRAGQGFLSILKVWESPSMLVRSYPHKCGRPPLAGSIWCKKVAQELNEIAFTVLLWWATPFIRSSEDVVRRSRCTEDVRSTGTLQTRKTPT